MSSQSAIPAFRNGLTAKAFPEVISYFDSAYQKHITADRSVGDILQRIAGGEWRERVERCRETLATNNAAGYTEAKRGLPAFALSGTLKTRRSEVKLEEKFSSHSGYLQADLDAKDNPALADLDGVADTLRRDPHIAFFFRSPSGKGLKCGVRIPAALKTHKDAFATVETHFLQKYSLQIDRSTKDATRLCFVSYDPDLWVNEDAREIAVTYEQVKKGVAPVYHEPLTTEADDVREMLKYIPPRPEYQRWLEIVSGVLSVLPESDAYRVLNEWSPEEESGEYEKKFRVSLKQIGLGTVVHFAKQGGFDAAAAARRKRWCGRINFGDSAKRAATIEPATKATTGAAVVAIAHVPLAPLRDGAPVEVAAEKVRNLMEDEQIGDARVFAAIMTGLRLYDHNAALWLRYDRGVWHRDHANATLGELIDTVSSAYGVLAETLRQRIAEFPAPAGSKDVREAELATIKRRIANLKKRGYAEAVFKFAAEALPTKTEDFDRAQHLLATENGTLDLDAGVHREFQSGDAITLRIPVRYDPAAQCPKWHAFLDTIFGDDAELKLFMRRAVGRVR